MFNPISCRSHALIRRILIIIIIIIIILSLAVQEFHTIRITFMPIAAVRTNDNHNALFLLMRIHSFHLAIASPVFGDARVEAHLRHHHQFMLVAMSYKNSTLSL